MSRMSAPSTAMWMSSSSTSHANVPASIWPFILSRPASIFSASSWGMTPWRASIFACAMEPAMSCAYMLLSSSSDAPNSCVNSLTPCSKRPDQSAIPVQSLVSLPWRPYATWTFSLCFCSSYSAAGPCVLDHVVAASVCSSMKPLEALRSKVSPSPYVARL